MFSCSTSLYASGRCSSVLEPVGVRVPARNIRTVSTFSCSTNLCPSAACSTVANAVCKPTDFLRKLCDKFKGFYTALVSCVLAFFFFVFPFVIELTQQILSQIGGTNM
jgi:hypothetical protein